MLDESPLKTSGSLTIFGLRSPKGPGATWVNIQGAGGSGGFGGDRNLRTPGYAY